MIIGWLVNLAFWILGLYTLVVWVRFFAEFGMALVPQWRPRGAIAMIFEIVFTLTDPPVKFFRRLVPPLRLGPIVLDFGILLTLVACNVASWLLSVIVAGIVSGGV